MNDGSAIPAPPPQNPVSIPLSTPCRAVALTADCVWTGAFNILEARDRRDGHLVGRRRTHADVLMPSPDGGSVLCAGFSTGYQSPDTICVERRRLAGSVEQIRRRVADAESGSADWRSSHDGIIAAGLSTALESTELFATWAWQPDLVDAFDDGQRVAVYVDTPDRRIQIWDVSRPADATHTIFLRGRDPSEMVVLAGGHECVIVEQIDGQQTSRVSRWRVADGACLAQYDLPRVTVSAMCRTMSPQHVILGFDRTLCVLNTQDGSVERELAIASGPVRKVRVDAAGTRCAVLTDEHMVTIDPNSLRQLQALPHGGVRGSSCDIDRMHVAALIAPPGGTQGTVLVLWTLSAL